MRYYYLAMYLKMAKDGQFAKFMRVFSDKRAPKEMENQMDFCKAKVN